MSNVLAGELQSVIEQIIDWKRKWYFKTEHPYGQFETILRLDQVYDVLWERVSLETTISNTFLTIVSLLTGTNIYDFEFFKYEWEIYTPDLESFLQGEYIKTTPIDINDLFRDYMKDKWNIELPEDFTLTPPNLTNVIIEPPLNIEIPQTYSPQPAWGCVYGYGKYDKCRYGSPEYNPEEEYEEYFEKSVIHRPAIYGHGIYDRDFYSRPNLTSTIQLIMTTLTIEPVTNIQIETYTSGLDINIDVLSSMMNKLNVIKAVQQKCFVAGLGIAGYTQICEDEETEFGRMYKLTYTDTKGNERTIYFTTIEELFFGFIPDLSVAGFDSSVTSYESFLSPKWFDFISYRIERTIDRFMSGYSAFAEANYDIYFWSYEDSFKKDYWADKQFLVRTFETFVKQLVSKIVKSPYLIRSYTSFAIDLLFSRSRAHGTEGRLLKDLPLDQYVNYIISKWKGRGLDEKIMRAIADRLKIYIEYIKREFKYMKELWLSRIPYQY